MLPRLLLAASLTFATACSPKKRQEAADRERLESPAAAAVLRHVLAECPHRTTARGLTLTIGEKMEQASPEFEKPFDSPALPLLSYRRLVAGAAGGKVRIFDEATGVSPIILQISSLTAPADGRQTAVAAWSWQEEAARHRYEVTTAPDGSFAVRTLEAIPVPPRNSDQLSRETKAAP